MHIKKSENGHDHEHSHEHGHDHSHGHSHDRGHGRCQGHGHAHEHGPACGGCSGDKAERPIITVRAASGLSGDMMLAGLACLADLDDASLDALVEELGMPNLAGSVRLERRFVQGVAGWGCRVSLAPEHAHRSLSGISALIDKSNMVPAAKESAIKAFTLLAGAEAKVHGKSPEEVHFHEVGALDSILDICLVTSIYVRLEPARFVCSPLPVADGGVHCAHGWLPTPAPAVLELLEGVPVQGFPGQGETVTPTAIALLKALGAEFGPWPAMTVQARALVYGSRVFENAPNGAVWALGLGKG